MGFKIQLSSPNLYFPIFLSLLFLLLSSSPYVSSSSPKLVPHRPRRSNLPSHHSTLYDGDRKHPPPTTAFLSNRREAVTAKKQRETKKKKKIAGFKNKPAAFSVMLPKGFVPPSGSSPCHNENPESIAFYCHLSTTKP